jgi:hypothetical protein
VPEAAYRVAPIFLIRMAGAPFEWLEQLASPQTTRLAREFITAETDFSRTREKVEQVLASRRHNLSREQFRAWRKAILHGVVPPANDPPSSAFAECWRAAANLAEAEARFQASLGEELAAARRALIKSARETLPGYLVFTGSGIGDLLAAEPEEPLPPRKKSLRARERHLLLYLQRICAKNDTLSAFGPHSWGRALASGQGIQLQPRPGISRREVFLERWTAHGIARAINADPEALAELSPRLNPAGRLEKSQFIFADTGETLSLEEDALAILRRCPERPAHSLGVTEEKLRVLAAQKLIVWELEVPALDPHATSTLVDQISGWRESRTRRRWLDQLRPIVELTNQFARTVEAEARFAIMEEANQRLEKLGTHKDRTRFLYAATNPIGEECFRESDFTIRQDLLEEVAVEAAPWIDLWRDSYAFVAGRVAAGLRAIFESAPRKGDALPLPYFLRLCTEAKLPLSGAGMVALAHLAFREVKERFRERLRDRAGERACQLTETDCHFVRQDFVYSKFDACTYPAADLQLLAASVEAINRGEYQWILAELHPPVALLHHGFYWSCPDKNALGQGIERTLCDQPYLYYGYFAADFTATTAVRLDAIARAVKFVAPERSVGDWETFHPPETEVFVTEDGDVAVRTRDSRRDLGSFARGWVIPLGFHPFSFSLGKHTPRLLCGKVVVQREAWTVSLEELGKGDFTGVSRDLVVAVENLRAARQLPRYIYIRPTEEALRRSGVEGRDKDTKPVFIDLESYLFLEIFHRWLVKAGELEITEMLPAPDQLLWQEADGRRTFEIRTQIVPA